MATAVQTHAENIASDTVKHLTGKYGTNLASGVLAGFVATLPMTIGMLLMHRYFPKRKKKYLPPVEITENLTEKVDAIPPLEEKKLLGASTAAHFAYGAAVGALYVPIEKALPMRPPAKGILFGLLVWAVSYLGLMPAVQLYPSAKDEPARMNILMILAHVIWGGSIGLLTSKINQSLAKG